jgi:hypothetical protein
MAVCGLGFIAGNFLSGPALTILWIHIGPVDSAWDVILPYLGPFITGLLVGGLAGLIWKGWTTGLAFGLAGCLIFTLAAVAGSFIYSFLFSTLGMESVVSSSVVNEGLRMSIFLVIGRSIFGGIAGILWGVFLDRSQRIGFGRLKVA